MIIDPEDIETCEKHLCNFISGGECHLCQGEMLAMMQVEKTLRLARRVEVLESFVRATINDGGASPSLKSVARDLIGY